MATVQCASIEKPVRSFVCDVIRPSSDMHYHEGTDGKLYPVQPEKKEEWTVLAETEGGARRIAEYHFYMSKVINVCAM